MLLLLGGLVSGLLVGLILPSTIPRARISPSPAVEAAPIAAGTSEQQRLEAELARLREAVALERQRLDAATRERQASATPRDAAPRPVPAPPPAPSAAVPPIAASVPPETPGTTAPALEPIARRPPEALIRPPLDLTPEPVARSARAPRLVLHHRAGSAAAAEVAQSTASLVREAGFDIADQREVSATPSQRLIRYFHAEDAALANRLAARLGGGWTVQDFRFFEPAPRPGTVELWLPER